MVIWLKKDTVLAIHDAQIAEHSGTSGIRDETLLESALAWPLQLYAYGDPAPNLADLAAALAFGLARNHPFVDGNKRTAAVSCETFVHLNGATLEANDLELFELYLALAEGKLTERRFAAWLRERLQFSTSRRTHEPPSTYRAKPRTTRKTASTRSAR